MHHTIGGFLPRAVQIRVGAKSSYGHGFLLIICSIERSFLSLILVTEFWYGGIL